LGAEPTYLAATDLAPWQTATRSARSRAATGVDSVAEAAALAAAGPGARLAVTRRTSRRGSCALAVTDPTATASKETST
ncbi:MAG: cobalamin biosynthesis protein, partial [Thiohalospira sp.]